ncbi:MAG: AI-2E family transporter, partial [Fimbriimonas ginsengisoli]|nr:AI-2E family transporter [Fimbriimonas ginsengisoli]
MVGWRIVLWAVLVVAALAFLFLVRSVLLPFILAFIVAAVLDPMIQRLRNHGWSKGLAIHAVFFGFILVGLVFGAWLIPVVGNQVSTMRDKFQVLVTTLTSPNRNDNFFVRWNPVVQVQQSESDNRVDRFLDQNRNLLDRLGLPTKSHVYMEKYVEPRRGEIGKAIETFFSGFLGIASGIASQMFLLLFTPLLAYMMLLDMDQFKRKSMMLIPPSIRSSATTILKDIGTVFMHYLRGVTIAVLGYMA